MARWGFHHLSGAAWERDQDGAGTYQASPSTLARLLLRSQASRKEKRPHPSSTQPRPYVWDIKHSIVGGTHDEYSG
jgi:hypothetical protein